MLKVIIKLLALTIHFLIRSPSSEREENILQQRKSSRQAANQTQYQTFAPRRANSGNMIPPAGHMYRSYSQDTNIAAVELELPTLTKGSHSETCLDNANQNSPTQRSLPNMRQREKGAQQSYQAPDDDVCSTDSSIVDDEIKRRRRKIHFPPFSKKSRSKD